MTSIYRDRLDVIKIYYFLILNSTLYFLLKIVCRS